MEDAELAIVLMGSSAGTAKAAVDELRESGVKAGLIKIRRVPPLPGGRAGRSSQGLQGRGCAGQERGLLRLRRPAVRRDALPPAINLTQTPQAGGHASTVWAAATSP